MHVEILYSACGMELKVNFFSPLGYIAKAESAKQRLQEEKEVGCFLKPSLKYYRKSLSKLLVCFVEQSFLMPSNFLAHSHMS